jgi:hypothetical protein
LEPVPPYNNGQDRWMSPREFRAKGGVWVVFAGIATPTIFTLASVLSNPRTFPMVLLHLANLLGYRRDLKAKADRWVEAEWSTGQPRSTRCPAPRRIRRCGWFTPAGRSP